MGKRHFLIVQTVLAALLLMAAEGWSATQSGRTDAQALGFSKGVKSVAFGFEAGFGYTYHFDRNGQLTSVEYTDHGDSGTLQMKNGRATRCDGVNEDFDSEEPTKKEPYHTTFSYRQDGIETTVFRTENKKSEKIGSLFYENGRIVRLITNGESKIFNYDKEGRAFTRSGMEVYPPLVIFFNETPTLPKNHQVKKRDGKGRTVEASATITTGSYNGDVTYNIGYW